MKITSDITKIEAIVEKWQIKLDALQEKIEAREEKFYDRSEKWQESDNGQEYEEETSRLQDFHLEVETKIEEITGALCELRELIENE